MNAAADRDSRWMRLAVEMAESGLGTTAPNPSVGAVLVRDGAEIARAVTQPGGRPHAETEVLRIAGEAARGATLYVTLEPCSHHGKTGPCAEAAIAAGVARVVVGIEDPDPRVAGRGIAMLRAAGVEVIVGVEAKACRHVTLGHILRVTERRPAVLIKMALMYDLSVPVGGGGRPNFVTSPEAREMGHYLRGHTDAIMVGSGTVRDDDPELTCRLPGYLHRSPRRIVLDGRLMALTPETKLARSAREVPVWAMIGTEAPLAKRLALQTRGVRLSVLPTVGFRPKLEEVMHLLADEGITRLMVEGGRAVWRTLASEGFVDEAMIFVQGHKRLAEFIPDGPVTFEHLSRLDVAPIMTLVEQGEVGGDKWFRFLRESA